MNTLPPRNGTVMTSTRLITAIAIGVCLVWPLRASAQCADTSAARRGLGGALTIAGVRITGSPPIIDGRLDEPAWSTAPVAAHFLQQRPTPYAPATDSTEARVLYDDHAIYIGMRMFRRDVREIASTVARRDYAGYSDWAQVMIDSYHDRRTAWRFGVNPAGVQKDALEFNDGNGEDLGWDAVWDAAAHVDSLGWTAEFRIPLSQLRFSTGGARADTSLVWGIDFIRDDASKNERDYWSPLPPDGSAFVSCFGELTGLRNLASPRRLEIVPYTLGSATRAPGAAADPFFRTTNVTGKVGVDVKYGLTSNLTLTAAINPDFGQVEADPSVVNLTAFQTFFPEKRPLFLEGEEFFAFNIDFPLFLPGSGFGNDQPFYSRRIGRQPQGSVPDTATFSDVPPSTTILGAAKISGKTANGWSLGMLDAVTERTDARYSVGSGAQLTAPVEPLTNYAVARGIKDFDQGRSALGAIITATDRELGGLTMDGLRSAAYAGGVDARHRFARGTYEVTASALGTYLRGNTAAITALQEAPGHWYQRPDAHYLSLDTARTSLTGGAASAQIAKIGGGHWRWQLSGHARTPGFDMNDIGFEQSADWLVAGAQLAYVDFTPGHVLRDWNASASIASGWSFGGERRATGLVGFFSLDFLNNWNVAANITNSLPALSLDALRGGPALRTPGSIDAGVQVTTDTRKAVSGSLAADDSREGETGGHSFTIQPSLSVRAGGRAEFSVGPSLSWLTNPWQYVSQVNFAAGGAPHYVFGRIAQTTVSLTARASYSFTPTLSLQFYGEPFVSAGDYSRFEEVRDPRAVRFDDRFRMFASSDVTYDSATRTYHVADGTSALSFGDPNFNVRQFRSTAVLRWEYRRGSTLYVVWSQGRSVFAPTGSFFLGRDVRELFGANATNTLEVKASYWLNW